MSLLFLILSPSLVDHRGLIAPRVQAQEIPASVDFPLPAKSYPGLPIVPDKRVILAVSVKKVSGFRKGWCTYWAAYRRARLGKPVTWHGNARYWYQNAKQQGYAVGATPKIGAILVQTKVSSRSCRGCGHVAIVEKIDGARYLVSEMNYIGFNKVSTRWLSGQGLFVY